MINEIMNIMNTINYGFLDKNGNNIFDFNNVEFIFNKTYYLMSPTELLNKKVGVCWDQVELERFLFEKNSIKNETYFMYVDDKKYLPSHTFLVYYMANKVYWFEHSWYDEKGIHEYNSINDLLNDVENKFIKSKEKEINSNLDIYIYKYNKPKYNISCDELFDFIYTQKRIINYKLLNATNKDLNRIINYKLETIMEYADNLSIEEINDINNYVHKNISTNLEKYNNIIYNNRIIGSFLIKNIDDGLLLDEIFDSFEDALIKSNEKNDRLLGKNLRSSSRSDLQRVIENHYKTVLKYMSIENQIESDTRDMVVSSENSIQKV